MRTLRCAPSPALQNPRPSAQYWSARVPSDCKGQPAPGGMPLLFPLPSLCTPHMHSGHLGTLTKWVHGDPTAYPGLLPQLLLASP